MSFPSCKHKTKKKPASLLAWLASEPFRLFFLSGGVWGAVAVLLWPLFHAGYYDFYPGIIHARMMTQTFAAAYVIGFLGTAGPRISTAPKLHPCELILLIALHYANGILHLLNRTKEADQIFLLTMSIFVLCLTTRIILFRKEALPPPIILAFSGILSTIIGTAIMITPKWLALPNMFMLSKNLTQQAFLLMPIMGIGSFLFPRIMGLEFTVFSNKKLASLARIRAVLAVCFMLTGIGLASSATPKIGSIICSLTFVIYLAWELPWKRIIRFPIRSSWNRALYLALIFSVCGIALPSIMPTYMMAHKHLLFIGGYGLLIFTVANRVLCGHSGMLDKIKGKSYFARAFYSLMIFTAATRMSADYLPRIRQSHLDYAAWLWAILVLTWLLWHRSRWFTRDPDE